MMNKPSQNIQQSLALSSRPHSSQKQLLIVFWIIALSLFLFELFLADTDSLLSKFGAILITIAALLPSYLWCSGKAMGMPIFPLFAITFTWTSALPLVTENPNILIYSPNAQFFASLTVTGFLFLGTLVWYTFVKSVPPLPNSYRTLNHQTGDAFFLLTLGLGNLFIIANNGGWFLTEGGIYTAVRAVVLGLVAIASFTLAYRLGNKDLSNQRSWLFIFLLFSYMLNSTVSLLLVGSSVLFLIAIVGFIFGSKKVPVLLIVIFSIAISFLHYGKGDMRSQYWFRNDYPEYFQPWEYPQLYVEWMGYSWDYLNKKDSLSISESGEKESLIQRSSLIQMLLLTQDKSPRSIPHLYGETYAILPELLIPRLFNPNKISSHEGTILLNLHYGVQKNRKETTVTTIAWGLLAESYANFGLLGCAGLGTILGFIYGKVTRWSINAPILSVQSLVAIIFMTFALQNEWTAGVYVAALFQSLVLIYGITIFLMKTYRVNYLTKI